MTNKKQVTIGVLSLQGSYHEHTTHLNQLFKQLSQDPKYNNYSFILRNVKTPSDLSDLNGLILPGGESTTMSILLQRNRLLEPLRELIQVKKIACWGTCAGLILLSNLVENTKVNLGDLEYSPIGGLNVTIERNSFGRQLDSFKTPYKLDNFYGDLKDVEFECVFIRGPVIKKLGTEGGGKNSVRAIQLTCTDTIPEVLLTIKQHGQDTIVAVKQDNILGTSFHPELVLGDTRFHKWFVDEFVLS